MATEEVVFTMAKYAVIGGYTADAWAKMVDNPGSREGAVSYTHLTLPTICSV